jgi:hypothetical protein
MGGKESVLVHTFFSNTSIIRKQKLEFIPQSDTHFMAPIFSMKAFRVNTLVPKPYSVC